MNATVKATDIDQAFDNGEDVSEYFDMEHPVRMEAVRTRKVNLTLPEWLIERLDSEAKTLAVSRNAVVNVWLADRARDEDRQRNTELVNSGSN
ncbi:type II toxin-antitoxin system BrnA family antitoxin [Bifidobacterium panos]|uniref:CopG family transcriptional regulator n=1 Tax=Bifidobacterium panos TaxID=2675321 RepID=A0ABX1SXX6_9BIFI|nr:CopG family antitoxin [Bifidobacterium sp. DSM 109963]NMN01642.1 CopG family transcriptional regulator [Bifidobacterium sp. DSM 109963]